MASTILIVEDNPEVAELLNRQLSDEGYQCNRVRDGAEALAEVHRHRPDLILLDRGLPSMTGDEVARRLRADPRSEKIPIIMLTGKAEESDELVGFALGADDYISKPFSPKLLLARIAAQLRRHAVAEREPVEMSASSVTLDRREPRVFVNNAAVRLTKTQYKILATLMAAGGLTLRRSQLVAMVYGSDSTADPHSFDGELDELQRKMGPAAACIQTIGRDVYAYCGPLAPRSTM